MVPGIKRIIPQVDDVLGFLPNIKEDRKKIKMALEKTPEELITGKVLK